MRKVIAVIIIMMLFPNMCYGAWLGYKQQDKEGNGIVLGYFTEELGSNAMSGDDLYKMTLAGDTVILEYGTECHILHKDMSKAKVRITSGHNTGTVCWIYRESLREGNLDKPKI